MFYSSVDCITVHDICCERGCTDESEVSLVSEEVLRDCGSVSDTVDGDIEIVLLEETEVLSDPDSNLVDITGDGGDDDLLLGLEGLDVSGDGLAEVGVVNECVGELGAVLESEVGVAVEHSRGCAEANIRACLPGWE